MEKEKNERDGAQSPSRMRIEVMKKGPYVVYGAPKLTVQTIETDAYGECRSFREGRSFPLAPEPARLCRCGASNGKPYCDGSHRTAEWDPELTAPHEGIQDRAVRYESGEMTLLDNERYCVLARFCEVGDGVWELAGRSGDPEAREEALHEAELCPGGRLMGREKGGPVREIRYAPSLGLIEDPQMGVSGGLWVRGGIPVSDPEGSFYEVRNRTVLCRCGQSHNKPCCDGTHVRIYWQDGIAEQAAEPQPEEVC